MADAVSVKNTEGHLTCSVCQNKHNEMVLSSCFHTFCTDCLQIQVNKSSNAKAYSCPLCKATVMLPDGYHGNHNKWDDQMSKLGAATAAFLFCDICVDKKIAINRCLQCEESFCEDCTNAHLKMKSSRYHGQRVVPIRPHHDNVFVESMEGTRFCPRHRGQEIIVVCKQCGVLLCLVCKLMEHPNHVTRTIKEDAVNIRQKISNLLQSQTGYSESLQIQIRLMEDKKAQFPRELDQELSKIRLQANKLHTAIEKEKGDAEKELVAHYNGYTMKSAKHEEYLKQDYDDYVALSKDAQQVVDSDNDVYVVKKGELIYDRLKRKESQNSILSDTDQDKPKKKFLAGEINDNQVSNLIGRITLDDKGKVVRIWTANSSVSNKSQVRHTPAVDQRSHSASTVSSSSGLNTTPQLLNQIWLPFTDGIGYIIGIAPAGNQKVWVTLLNHKYVVLIDQQGIVQRQVDIGEICEGVASDGEGGCFVTCPQNKSIKRINRSGEVSTLLDNLMQDPHGIATLVHYDPRQFIMFQELYVCFTEPRSFDVDMSSHVKHGCVRTLSFTGTDLGITFQVKSPVRIAVSPETQMLAVVDYSNGCVMTTDKTGKSVHALYSGQDNDDLFQPLGVCFDGSGRVLFADWKKGKVCQMALDGSWVRDLINKLDGPQSLTVTDGNTIWVGAKLGKMYVYRQK